MIMKDMLGDLALLQMVSLRICVVCVLSDMLISYTNI